MSKQFNRFLSILLSVSMLLSCFITTASAKEPSGVQVSVREERVESVNGLYKLVVSLEGISDAKSIYVSLAYNKEAITPSRSSGADLSKPTGYSVEALAEGTEEEPSKISVRAVETDEYMTFYTGVYVTAGAIDCGSKTDVLAIYYKIKDESKMNVASWRFATTDEVRALYQDTTGASVKVTDSGSGSNMKTYAYNADAGCATDGGIIEANGFTFTGCDKDALKAVAITGAEDGLTVPEKGKTATLQLGVTLTGLDGDYSGSDAKTTWSITNDGNTGATIEPETGLLSIGSTGNAGTVKVQATTTAGGVTLHATADVQVTKGESVPTTVKITGENEIIVPCANDPGHTPGEPVSPVTKQYTATVTDQYGDTIQEPTVTWSATIDPADSGVTFQRGTLTVADGAAENGDVTVTITAEAGSVQNTMTVTVKRDRSVFNIEIVDEDNKEHGMTPVDGYSITIPSSGSNTLILYARGDDKYGNEINQSYTAEWETTLPATMYSVSGNQITITVPAGTTAQDYTLKATINNKYEETTIHVVNKTPVEVDMSGVTVTGVTDDGTKVYDSQPVGYSGSASITPAVDEITYTW